MEPKLSALQNLPESWWGRCVPGDTVLGAYCGRGAGDGAGLALELQRQDCGEGPCWGQFPGPVPLQSALWPYEGDSLVGRGEKGIPPRVTPAEGKKSGPQWVPLNPALPWGSRRQPRALPASLSPPCWLCDLRPGVGPLEIQCPPLGREEVTLLLLRLDELNPRLLAEFLVPSRPALNKTFHFPFHSFV